jgi:adenylosuccinate synthase
VFYPDVLVALGSGMVIDPAGLFEEMSILQKAGYRCKNIRISPLAHLVLPYHRDIDRFQEKGRGKRAIGTTQKGIGPAYADKAERSGLRIVDLLDTKAFDEKFKYNLEVKRSRYQGLFNGKFDTKSILRNYKEYGEKMFPMLTDVSKLILDKIDQGKDILCEGAQGTMLDIDFGTYPYVTSSPTTAGGVAVGLGIPPQMIDEVFGVAKAYTTRVGEGSFPTEQTGKVGEFLRERGCEFGTTTGRPRRCGWLDGMVLRYGHRLNGYSGLVITKLDVLTGLDEIKFCEAYQVGGKRITDFPTDPKVYASAKPVYKTFPGWEEDISNAKKIAQLPKACRAYLSYIEEYSGVPIRYVSIGADRDSMIVR